MLQIFFLIIGVQVGSIAITAAAAASDYYASPCPTIFQIGLDARDRPVGIIDLTVPKNEVYQINVTATFALISSNLDAYPKVYFTNKANPEEIIKKVLTGESIRLMANYKRALFKLYRIILNNKVVCEDRSVGSESNYKYSVMDIFEAPVDDISKFKDSFPIQYNDANCGVPKLHVDDRKYLTLSHGGTRADWIDWPWVVSIYVSKDYVCTGNLISKSVALTAAHCFVDGIATHRNIQIRLFNNQSVSTWGYLRHKTHNEYKDDIALVYLASDVNDPRFVPVCISQSVPSMAKGALVSFGEDELGRTERLNYLALNSVTNNVCRASNSVLQSLVTESHFCGGNSDGTGPCSGDSGGGFLFKEGQRWYLRGLLSSALKNEQQTCDTNNYAIFIDMLYYNSWLPSKKTENAAVSSIRPAQPLVTQSCGGLTTSSDEFISNRNWIVQVDSANGYSWWGVLISPNHVLTNILPKYSKSARDLTVSIANCADCLLSNVATIQRMGSAWYHPTVLKLEQPLAGVTAVCINRNNVQSSEEVQLIEVGDTSKIEKATFTHSQECVQKLMQNSRLKATGKYNPEGIATSSAYCQNPIKPGELAIQKHRSTQGEFWSLFGYWLVDDVFTSLENYINDIVTATRH